MFAVKHNTTPPYHSRSKGLAERFGDTLKRTLRKLSKKVTDKAVQFYNKP